MAEHVSPVDLGVSWEPNAPDAVLISDDVGTTSLAVRAHFDDADQRCVVLMWTGTESASMAALTDGAISGHRLYDNGLRGLWWAGVVQQSQFIKELDRQNRVHPAHDPSRYAHLAHHIVLLKEGVVEVVARALRTERHRGSTLDSAVAGLSR